MCTALLGDVGLLRTLATLLGLGLIMAFSPTTFGIELKIIRHAHRPRRQVLVIMAAVALAATMLAALMLLVNPAALRALWTATVQPLIQQRWLDAALGALLVAAGVIQWMRATTNRPIKHRSWTIWTVPVCCWVSSASRASPTTTGPATMYLVVSTIRATPPALWAFQYVIFLVGLATPHVLLPIAVSRIPNARRWCSRSLTALNRRDVRFLAAGVSSPSVSPSSDGRRSRSCEAPKAKAATGDRSAPISNPVHLLLTPLSLQPIRCPWRRSPGQAD